MATTTPNFGWSVPTSTDLVKDGATAIETLGDSIDASLVDLKGGTTGQILSKATNTDLDFTWVAPIAGDITAVTAGTGISGGGTSGDVTITNLMATEIDAKGDLIAGTGADAFSRIAVGANNLVLTADSTASTGIKWATGSSITQLATGSLSGSNLTLSSINQTYKDLILVINNAYVSIDDARAVTVRVNADSTANRHVSVNTGASNNQSFLNTEWYVYPQADNTVGGGYSTLTIYDYTNTTAMKTGFSLSMAPNATTVTNVNYQTYYHMYNQTTAISSLYLATGSGTWSAGTYTLYGVK